MLIPKKPLDAYFDLVKGVSRKELTHNMAEYFSSRANAGLQNLSIRRYKYKNIETKIMHTAFENYAFFRLKLSIYYIGIQYKWGRCGVIYRGIWRPIR